jgi:hypothetical protein
MFENQFRDKCLVRPGHWPTLLLLGMLVLRGLVPAGFMLAPENGRLAFVLCSVGMPMGHHPPSHHPAGHHSEGAHADPTCPYAQSGAPAPLPTFPVLSQVAHVDVLRQPAALAQVFLPSGPRREPSSRGPPAHTDR